MDRERRRIRYPREAAAAMPVPQSAKEILSGSGLPGDHEFFSAADTLRVTARGYCRIGGDYATDICVDDAGRVVSTSESGVLPDRFVNSDTASFVRFLELVEAEREAMATRRDDEPVNAVEALAETLAKIDGAAFEDPENWWSVIFEQMTHGLL